MASFELMESDLAPLVELILLLLLFNLKSMTCSCGLVFLSALLSGSCILYFSMLMSRCLKSCRSEGGCCWPGVRACNDVYCLTLPIIAGPSAPLATPSSTTGEASSYGSSCIWLKLLTCIWGA